MTERILTYILKLIVLPFFLVASLLDLLNGRSLSQVLRSLVRVYTTL